MALSTGVACNEGEDCSAGGVGAWPAGGVAMDPVVSGLAAAAAGVWVAGVASPSLVDVEQPARMPARPASPAATRIITRPALIVITAPHRPGRTGWAKLSDDG
jgi:hypothetical protein